jgi:insecticidal toxin complex protein TccC
MQLHRLLGFSKGYGQLIEHYDQAGVWHFQEFDLEGRCVTAERRLVAWNHPQQFANPIDWTDPDRIGLAIESFRNETRYNAAGQLLQQKQADGSVLLQQYGISGKLNSMQLGLPNQAPKTLIAGIQHHATGQREQVRYGNGVVTDFHYQPKTRYLSKWLSTHPEKNLTLQDMSYQYDAIGNITEIEDKSYQALFPKASSVPTTIGMYVYDSLYRLRQASGKEVDKFDRHALIASYYVSSVIYLEVYPREYQGDLG